MKGRRHIFQTMSRHSFFATVCVQNSSVSETFFRSTVDFLLLIPNFGFVEYCAIASGSEPKHFLHCNKFKQSTFELITLYLVGLSEAKNRFFAIVSKEGRKSPNNTAMSTPFKSSNLRRLSLHANTAQGTTKVA